MVSQITSTAAPNNNPCVITGLGVISGMGLGAAALWKGLDEGPSSVKTAARIRVPKDLGICPLASEVPANFSAKDFVPKHYRKAVKVMARDSELAVIAAADAVADAKCLTRSTAVDAESAPLPTTYPSGRLGCHIGAGLLPAEVAEIAPAFASSTNARGEFSLAHWGTIAPESTNPMAEPAITSGGMANLQPLWMLKYLPNMLACHVTIVHGAEGPSNTITCGEASGLLCIGESNRVIQRGAADACFSGGAESKVNLMGTLRSLLLGRLAPAGMPLPYDPASPGTVPGEGGGIVLIERLGLAVARSASIYAIIAGFGAAQSLTRGGRSGLALAIAAALRDARLSPGDIDVVVPQALGLPSADAKEAAALHEVFGTRLIPLITLPPMIGDCAAGAGGLAVAAAALCIKHQSLPRAATLHAPAAPPRIRHVLVCSGSISGQNAAIVLSALNQ